jgi:hypothetical protein
MLDVILLEGAERRIWLFILMAGYPQVPAHAIQYFHDQLKAFIENHSPKDAYLIKSVVNYVG